MEKGKRENEMERDIESRNDRKTEWLTMTKKQLNTETQMHIVRET